MRSLRRSPHLDRCVLVRDRGEAWEGGVLTQQNVNLIIEMIFAVGLAYAVFVRDR